MKAAQTTEHVAKASLTRQVKGLAAILGWLLVTFGTGLAQSTV
jgi:hypothetical protein